MKHGTTPRGIYESYLDDLRAITGPIIGCDHLHLPPDEIAPELTARETAERHAEDIKGGNIQRVMCDFVGSTFMNLMAGGAMPPMPTTKTEILSEDVDGDAVRFHVRYSNDTAALELKTRWEKVGPDWKIVEARKVDAPAS
jgi:hypothetical protein